jgi:plasmid stability protein
MGAGTSAQVLVRNLDEAIRSLKLKAGLKKRPLEQELREILLSSAGLSPKEKVALSDQVRAMQARPLADASAGLIRDDRECGWR